MSDIPELETRITTALERISAGLRALAPAGTSEPGEVAALAAALEEERTVSAQLEWRMRSIQKKQDSTVETLTAEVERMRVLLEIEEKAFTKLRQVNNDLRANNAALRQAVNQGVSEPHLINKSMMAEMECLRAAQNADRIELDAVLGELTGLIADANTKESADA